MIIIIVILMIIIIIILIIITIIIIIFAIFIFANFIIIIILIIIFTIIIITKVASFDYLFDKALLPGGCYIVEDIETSYWTKNGLYGYTTRWGVVKSYYAHHICIYICTYSYIHTHSFSSSDTITSICRYIHIHTYNSLSSDTASITRSQRWRCSKTYWMT